MILWAVFALMTGAAILVVVWPLGREPHKGGGDDLIVYKDQLQEIDRDRTAGLIGEAEAETARLEVSRRLLAAADARPLVASAAPAPRRNRRVAAIAALVILPLVPSSLYVALGSPNVPWSPAFVRVKTPQGVDSISNLVSQVEARLSSNPDDGAGWEVIAPVYLRLGRFDDAVRARRKSLALNGENATRQSDLGEAVVAAANGIVTADAKLAFERAVALDQHEPKARYFLGLAAEQDGKKDEAATIWRAMLNDTPGYAPWKRFVSEALTRVTRKPDPAPMLGAAEGPRAEDVAAAANMSDEQRNEMIRGMVARLADRLRDDGADVEGWLRLVRAYMVLGERDKAKSAAADAKHALADRPEQIKQIEDLIKGLGLDG